VLNDNLTVGQHLRYFAAAHRLRSLARAGELMNLLGYEQYRGQVAGELSGGTRQFPVAWRLSLRNQARNRLAWLLLVAFVPVWYELMLDIAGHTPLTFKLYATGLGHPGRAGRLPGRPAGLVRHRVGRPGAAAAGDLRP